MSLVAAVTGLVGISPASAQVPAAQANYSGFATGSVAHVGAATLPGGNNTTVATVEQAFSGSAVNSQGLGQIIDKDLDSNPLVQAASSANSGARGAGVEVGLLNGAGVPAQIALQKAVVTAPPASSLDNHVGPITISSIVTATLLRGAATANYNPGGCLLGTDLSKGTGEAAEAQVLGVGAAAAVNAPGDATTTSREVLVPQQDINGATVGNGVGLMSEVAGTTAPVALLGGALTITVIGKIGLRAVATGVAGTSYVQETYPSAVRVDGPLGVNLLNIPIGPGGVSLPLQTINLAVAQVTLQIGAPPHAIGSDINVAPTIAADGSSVSAVTDIVKVKAVALGITVADVRVGHMEASATVPTGGIQCQIDVTKTAQPTSVNPGDTFKYLITVHNPHACTLVGVRVVDTVSATSGVAFKLISAVPPADSQTSTTLIYNDIGPIAPGDTKTITVNMQVLSSSRAGVLTETANATASCAIANASGTSTVAVSAAGGTTLTGPTVGGLQGRALPVTGGQDGRFYAVALLAGLAAVAAGRKGLLAMFSGGPGA